LARSIAGGSRGGVCAYQRGEDTLAVVRIGATDGAQLNSSVGGRWREVLSGRELGLERECSVDALVDDDGLALLERLSD
jgi:hypothetical protein